MKKTIQIIFTVVIVLFFSCSQGYFYGNKIDEASKDISIKSALSINSSDDEYYKITGTISAQCKEDQCWLELTEKMDTLYIDLKPGQFTIPLSVNKKAIIQGKLIKTGDVIQMHAENVVVLN